MAVLHGPECLDITNWLLGLLNLLNKHSYPLKAGYLITTNCASPYVYKESYYPINGAVSLQQTHADARWINIVFGNIAYQFVIAENSCHLMSKFS